MASGNTAGGGFQLIKVNRNPQEVSREHGNPNLSSCPLISWDVPHCLNPAGARGKGPIGTSPSGQPPPEYSLGWGWGGDSEGEKEGASVKQETFPCPPLHPSVWHSGLEYVVLPFHRMFLILECPLVLVFLENFYTSLFSSQSLSKASLISFIN